MGQVFPFFFSMNVNCHSTLWYICSITCVCVCVCVCACVCVCVCVFLARVCRAVEPLTDADPLSYPPIFCVLLSGLPPPWQTLWKPEQALQRQGLTECFTESWMPSKDWKVSHIYCHSQALCLATCLYMLVLSHYRLIKRLAGGW